MKIRVVDNSGISIEHSLKISKKDILVFRYDGFLNTLQGNEIYKSLKRGLEENKVLLLDKKMTLEVLTFEEDNYKGADNGTLTDED